jgi:deoxycytidine triphosphate deaminase
MDKHWKWLSAKAVSLLPSALLLPGRKEQERERLRNLPSSNETQFGQCGVLLSHDIKSLVDSQQLIHPFSERKLKPAAYELSVGSLYSISGKTYELVDEPGRNEIKIPPFEVVVIQTLETLNMPRFLIGRWNLKTRWAYKGLLWVGGPQVDPGFKGYLACPIYNLSDKPVSLRYEEEIAVLDFVTTTPFDPDRSQPYKPLERTRILFEDYEPNNLQSALAKMAKEKIEGFGRTVEELKVTLFSATAVTMGALGIIVAALGLFVSGERKVLPALWSADTYLGTGVLAISIWIFVIARPRLKSIFTDTPARPIRVVELLLVSLALVLAGAGLVRTLSEHDRLIDLEDRVRRLEVQPESPDSNSFIDKSKSGESQKQRTKSK